MFTDATSLTTTPTRLPSLFSRMCLSSVVFPEPRNPESSVTAMGDAALPPAMSSARRADATGGDGVHHVAEGTMASAMRARSAMVSLGANRFARQQGAQLGGGVKFEFGARRAMTEMTAIYTVCLHTVQTVPWYR